jgi:hypothetical protein
MGKSIKFPTVLTYTATSIAKSTFSNTDLNNYSLAISDVPFYDVLKMFDKAQNKKVGILVENFNSPTKVSVRFFMLKSLTTVKKMPLDSFFYEIPYRFLIGYDNITKPFDDWWYNDYRLLNLNNEKLGMLAAAQLHNTRIGRNFSIDKIRISLGKNAQSNEPDVAINLLDDRSNVVLGIGPGGATTGVKIPTV